VNETVIKYQGEESGVQLGCNYYDSFLVQWYWDWRAIIIGLVMPKWERLYWDRW